VTEEGSKLLVKAAEAIAAARILLENGQANFAAGRAYYAMFYVAEALLVEDGLRSRSHSGVHALFGERFAKVGRLEPKYHRWMLAAFEARIEGDYGFDAALTREEVQTTIERAVEFHATAKEHLSSPPRA
jgi:uncharacterized protein (UPF0332 family)